MDLTSLYTNIPNAGEMSAVNIAFANYSKKKKTYKEYSQTKIEFLHVLVKKQNNMLQTTTYRKQTDCYNYLDAQSWHPKLLKNSIP